MLRKITDCESLRNYQENVYHGVYFSRAAVRKLTVLKIYWEKKLYSAQAF